MSTHLLPSQLHDSNIFWTVEIKLAEETVLHIIQHVPVHSISRPLTLQFEHNHATVMAWEKAWENSNMRIKSCGSFSLWRWHYQALQTKREPAKIITNSCQPRLLLLSPTELTESTSFPQAHPPLGFLINLRSDTLPETLCLAVTHFFKH